MTQETLIAAIIQLDQVWEDSTANRLKLDEWLQKINKNTDVVFLAEMFNTGFSLNTSALAETMVGETVRWMKQRSAEYGFALCGSLIISENDLYYNRLIFAEPTGEVHFYNKRHLFTMEGEESQFQQGMERIIVLYKGWRICPLICYDLRFPVWARNRNEYDLLVYSASWPQARDEVWNTLLKARAIENQAYVVGANRVGVDGNSIGYSGNSQVIDPKGSVLAMTEEYVENIVVVPLSYNELLRFRLDFPVLNDVDSFCLE